MDHESLSSGTAVAEMDAGDWPEEHGSERVGDDGFALDLDADNHAEPNQDPRDEAAVTSGSRWSRAFAFGVLPAVVVALAAIVGFLSYRDHSAMTADNARGESVRAATESTVALLSYQADTADKTLGDARDRLTGTFRDAYSQLIHDVVIPGAKQKHISSVVTVPAAASISASGQHAVVLVFVDQSVIVGSDAPTSNSSCIRVTLDKVGSRWLISQFDPI